MNNINYIIKNAYDYYLLCSYASDIITKEIQKYSPEMEKYRDQINKILAERYGKELGFNPQYFSESNPEFDKLIPEKLFVSINPETNEVISVSGINTNYGANRAMMFGSKQIELQDSGAMKKALFQQLEEVFKAPNTFAEFSESLFKQFMRMYNFYTKMNNGEKPFNLYYFPAESAAKLIPNRKMFVSKDGVKYTKLVHGAGTFASKMTIANSPEINGAMGYPTFEEASSASKYKGKLIEYKHGDIKVLDIIPGFIPEEVSQTM